MWWTCRRCTLRNQTDTAAEKNSEEDGEEGSREPRCEACDHSRTPAASPARSGMKRARAEGEEEEEEECDGVMVMDHFDHDEVDMTSPDLPTHWPRYQTAAASSAAVATTSTSCIAAAATPSPPLALKSRAASVPVRPSPPAAASSASFGISPTLSKGEKAEQRQREREEKAAAKAELKLDSELLKLVQRAAKGTYANEEVHAVLHDSLRSSHYGPLTKGLTDGKLSFSFASAAAAAVAASSSAATLASPPLSPCSAIPYSVVFQRRQAPSVVAQIRARKRMRGAPISQWKTLEDEQKHQELHTAEDERRVQECKAHIMDELPPPAPIHTVVSLLDGAELISLHSAQQFQPTIDRWLSACTRHDSQQTLLLVVYGLYGLVQMGASQALQQRRAASPTPTATSAPPTAMPLKKLTDVDALVASIWFRSRGKVRFKLLDSLSDCLDWLVVLASVLAKAPYKETDNALTLVNNNRTDRMRGGDDFSPRPPPRSSPSDDDGSDSEAGIAQQRRNAKSTMLESWQLYLMQIPRFSERLALTITRAYPSFTKLWTAYSQCATDKHRETLVQDLPVGGAAPTPGVRVTRVGPALSASLYQAIWASQAATVASS